MVLFVLKTTIYAGNGRSRQRHGARESTLPVNRGDASDPASSCVADGLCNGDGHNGGA